MNTPGSTQLPSKLVNTPTIIRRYDMAAMFDSSPRQMHALEFSTRTLTLRTHTYAYIRTYTKTSCKQTTHATRQLYTNNV